MSPVPTSEQRERFERAQAALVEASRHSEHARLSLFAATESVRRAERDHERLDERTKTQQLRAKAAADARTMLIEGREQFEPFTDPRIGVRHLNDATPFLLFPLRLETRFGTTLRDGLAQPQLWVRVYPDDCLVDSFQPLPSETEIASTRQYWIAMWKARGIEGDERAAWRSLVASHGSGRAAWLERNYRPLNLGAKPNIPAADALVLVIPTEAVIADPEAAAIAELWKAVWLAGGEPAGLAQAMTDFGATIADAGHAQMLIDEYEPVNLTAEPPRGVARNAVQVSVSFVVFPPAADVDAATRSWSQPARSFALPDRLMLIGYVGDKNVLEELGRVIPWPLHVGPDPQAAPADQIRQEDGEIKVGDDLKWLTDFDRAVAIGIGFRVDLTSALAEHGFDELFVIGLRISANAGEGQRLLETLLEHHRDGSSGFAILSQGTPTNNTENESSGFTRTEEADRTFDERLHPGTDLRLNSPWYERLDGEWLADALGIDPSLLNTVGGSRNTDQLEAHAMNVALWPATLGYSLETILHPIFDADDVDRVRWFYEHFVSGRGWLPAIRLGRQPYCVLPTAPLSQLQWTDDPDLRGVPGMTNLPGFRRMMPRLYQVVKEMAGDWAGLVAKVSRVGGPGDPHQVLLDILGLHAASVEHYQRFAESVDDLYNRVRFYGFGAQIIAILEALQYQASGRILLERFNITDTTPDILNRLFLDSPSLLRGPFVDEVPLSEGAALQPATDQGWNYIEWLRRSAQTSLETLRQESGFTGNKIPRALLYLLLRHSLLQSYWDSGLRLGKDRGVLDAAAVKAARQEPPFIHVKEKAQAAESRWQLLYSQDAALTGNAAIRVGDFLTGAIGTEPAASHLVRMIRALDRLEEVSTARLERLFAEHLDTCTYRLDAWQQGFAHYALALSRYDIDTGAPVTRRGVLLGAFGWLESVRPKTRRLETVQPAPGIHSSFFRGPAPVRDASHGGHDTAAPTPVLPTGTPLDPHPHDADTTMPMDHGTAPTAHDAHAHHPGMDMHAPPAAPPPAPVEPAPIAPTTTPLDVRTSMLGPLLPPLMHDPTNGGYIHAPSLNQSVAAAVLRNGYLANASPSNPGAFAVNLSSERVRRALWYLEGIRQGQRLGALLGYQLERALHDRWALGEIDEHIYALRKKFPLAADRDPDTQSDPTDSIETVEAKNVVDGLRLVEYVKGLSSRAYPFGFTDLPSGDNGKGAAIDREIERLLEAVDAIADLNIANSVYHAVLSNYDGVAATLDSSGHGQMPPQPAIIETPRSGRTVTHRVSLHLQSGLDEDISPIGGLPVTPRARLEPAINTWLARMLPSPDTVACTIRWFDVGANALATQIVTQADLGLQPIDLLRIGSFESDQAMNELDDRILLFAHETFVARADSAVTIQYRTPMAGSVSFFELSPLIAALRSLLQGRPLRPTDVVAQGTASAAMDRAIRVDATRITKVRTSLTTLRDDLVTFRDELAALHGANPIDETAIRDDLDDRLTDFAGLLQRAASFSLSDSGWGFVVDFKARWFASVLEVVRTKAERFASRLADCDTRLGAYDAAEVGMTEPERLLALDKIERLVRVASTMRTHANAAAYRIAVAAARGTYSTRLTQFRTLLTIETQEVATLRIAVHAVMEGPPSIDTLDAEPVDLSNFDEAIVTASADLLARATRLVKSINEQRLTPVADLLTKYNATVDPIASAALLTEAAKKLAGDDALLVPEFKLDDTQGPTLQAAYDAAVAGDPLQWQRTVKHTPEPVDTWLYGVARVRDKLQAWEQAVMLEGGFGAVEPELTPLQIPWKPGEHWLGLEFPPGFEPDGDRLCLTGHFFNSFDHTEWQCGLLLDEWTEVIPAKQETTGLTFHFDRPNSEAPQALLLVTPPAFTGAWKWSDIVDAVRDTLARARSRAVEPTHVDETAYARFLPMTVMATTLHQISIVTNLARNNDFLQYMAENDG